MAKAAGIVAVWARYGTIYDKKLRDLLVRVTHWTEADVNREAEYAFSRDSLRPDYSIDRYSEILTLLDKPRATA
jgi:phosphoglycolate phosphatase